jgi:ornithine carbamoyltransferase
MTSCIVARVGPHSDIAELAKNSSVPVINALSDLYHPLQAVTDIMTIAEAFPNGIEGLKVAWVGDANNVLYDLMIACAKLGINISIATPPNYPVDAGMLKTAQEAAQISGSKIETTNVPTTAVKDAHVIVTDTWVSMGQESEKKERLAQFAGYQVSMEMAEKGGANKDWKFMHCLPRKPEEVTDEVFYSPRSLVFTEAENRLYAAIAALEAFVVKKGNFEEL